MYSYISNKRTRPIILFNKKVQPTLWFSCNRLKIPSYPTALQVGWIFPSYPFMREVFYRTALCDLTRKQWYMFAHTRRKSIYVPEVKLGLIFLVKLQSALLDSIPKLNRNWNRFWILPNTHWAGQTKELCITLKRSNIMKMLRPVPQSKCYLVLVF